MFNAHNVSIIVFCNELEFFALSYRFYSHCEGYEPTLLLIRTTDGDVSNTYTCRNPSNGPITQARIKEYITRMNVLTVVMKP